MKLKRIAEFIGGILLLTLVIAMFLAFLCIGSLAIFTGIVILSSYIHWIVMVPLGITFIAVGVVTMISAIFDTIKMIKGEF